MFIHWIFELPKIRTIEINKDKPKTPSQTINLKKIIKKNIS